MTTKTLPARVPDGWWVAHTRYRYYVLFAIASGFLAIVCMVLLAGLRALSQGAQAWAAFQSDLGTAPGLVFSAVLLIAISFFAMRWLRVGAKVPQVAIGPMPAPAGWLILILHFAGLATISLVLLLLLSGAVV